MDFEDIEQCIEEAKLTADDLGISQHTAGERKYNARINKKQFEKISDEISRRTVNKSIDKYQKEYNKIASLTGKDEKGNSNLDKWKNITKRIKKEIGVETSPENEMQDVMSVRKIALDIPPSKVNDTLAQKIAIKEIRKRLGKEKVAERLNVQEKTLSAAQKIAASKNGNLVTDKSGIVGKNFYIDFSLGVYKLKGAKDCIDGILKEGNKMYAIEKKISPESGNRQYVNILKNFVEASILNSLLPIIVVKDNKQKEIIQNSLNKFDDSSLTKLLENKGIKILTQTSFLNHLQNKKYNIKVLASKNLSKSDVAYLRSKGVKI